MADDKFDELLKRMPDIASAINAFASEEIQKEAFAILMDGYLGSGFKRPNVVAHESFETRTPTQSNAEDVQEPQNGSARNKGKRQRRSGGGSSRDGFKLIRDLELNPSGKTSFAAFAAEKQPKSNEDKLAVAVHWLQHVAEVQNISANHVGTVFRYTDGWREPSNVSASLRVAATRKGHFDTSKSDDIRTTPQGRNFVEHDLPPTAKPKK